MEEYGWYWGPLSCEAAEKVLSNEPDGSFIVRDSSDDHYIFSLSFKLKNCVRHVRIEQDQGTFSFGSYAKFQSQAITEFIEKAVEHSRSGRYLFFLHRRPEHGPMRVQLTNPVSRFKHIQSLQHMCRANNKVNMQQKTIMAEFMKEHSNLAKNILPNCVQGKATAIKLWEQLSKKLNAVGPPVKDAKMWRKVYADQKYQAKKKLSFNKASKKQTGGGPYEEKLITAVEENIIEASGLEVTVEGLSTVMTFGRSSTDKVMENMDGDSDDIGLHLGAQNETSLISDDVQIEDENEQPPPKKRKKTAAIDPKLALLEQHLKLSSEGQIQMLAKLDRLVTIEERVLEIKEEKFKCFKEMHKIELEIKKKELSIMNCDEMSM